MPVSAGSGEAGADGGDCATVKRAAGRGDGLSLKETLKAFTTGA